MQYNIFQNNFYDDRPGVPWAYRLTVFTGDPPMDLVRLTQAVKEVNIPDIELNTFQVHYGGMLFYIPTRYKNSGNFQVRFNENKNLHVYKTILDLFHRTYDNRDEEILVNGKIQNPKYSDFTRDLNVMVEILDPANFSLKDTKTKLGNNDNLIGTESFDLDTVAKYVFTDCYVENIDDIDLDYSSEDCVEWSLNIKFNGIRKEYKDKKKVKIESSTDVNDDDGIAIPASNHDDDAYVPAKKRKVDDTVFNQDIDKTSSVEAYNKAKRALEEEKRKAKEERENAVAKASAVANSEGMTPEGDYVTVKQREAAKEQVEAEVAEQLDQKYNVSEFAELGVDLTAPKKEVVQQAQNLENAVVMEGGQTRYDLPSWDTSQQIVQKSEDLKKEASDADKEIDFAWRETGAVEMNDKSSTNKYYSERQTDEQKADHLNQRAAKIQASQKIINDYEQERAHWEQKKRNEYTMFRNQTGSYSNGDYNRRYKIWDENTESYNAKIREIDARIESESKKLEALQSEPDK